LFITLVLFNQTDQNNQAHVTKAIETVLDRLSFAGQLGISDTPKIFQ